MSSKKALELPVNFMVMLIISIIIFGLSLFIFFKVREGLKPITVQIDEQTEAELRRLMRQELAIVAIPYPVQQLPAGRVATVWVGIRNTFTTPQRFIVHSHFSHASMPDFSIIEVNGSEVDERWLGGFKILETEEMAPREYATVPIVIKTKNRIGEKVLPMNSQVVFNVCVYPSGTNISECDPKEPGISNLLYGKMNQISVVFS